MCSTCVYVLQSHVSSFGVTYHELMTAWYVPRPNIGTSGTRDGKLVGLGGGFLGSILIWSFRALN